MLCDDGFKRFLQSPLTDIEFRVFCYTEFMEEIQKQTEIHRMAQSQPAPKSQELTPKSQLRRVGNSPYLGWSHVVWEKFHTFEELIKLPLVD